MRIPWNKTEYDDEWIVANLYVYPSYKALAEAHNEKFGTNIGATAIGGHVKHKLGIDKQRLSGEFLTDEQKAFIEEYYPHHSVDDTTKAFNEKFGTDKKRWTMLNYARRHGLVVDEEIVTKSKRFPHRIGGTSKNAEREIGATRFDGRYWLIKTESGWETCHRAVWEEHHGKIKKGYAVIYLDGDITNWSEENLAEVPISYLGMLDRNGLRSKHPVLTEAGILWCDLQVAIDNATPPRVKPRVIQKTLQGETVGTYSCLTEAIKQTGIKHISNVCCGTRQTAGGYVWEYERRQNNEF